MSNQNTEKLNKQHGSIGDSVLIKETGEQSIIKGSYGIFQIEMNLELEDLNKESTKKIYEDFYQKFTFRSDEPREENGWHYVLDTGQKLHESDVVVGKDIIRDYKIEQINK